MIGLEVFQSPRRVLISSGSINMLRLPGWCFNAALRYAAFTSSAVADFSMPKTLYGSIVGGSSSSRSISCLRGILQSLWMEWEVEGRKSEVLLTWKMVSAGETRSGEKARLVRVLA